MFEALSEQLEAAWKKLRGQDKLTASNIQEPLKVVRRALIDADVSVQVVREFIQGVETRAVGKEVISGVRPDQQFIKVVYDELVQVMGTEQVPLITAPQSPSIILMAGLQGTGKTTAAAKLALYLKKQDKKPLLVATDIYRPAAIDQLQTLGRQIGVPVFALGTDVNPVTIAQQGVAHAQSEGCDWVIVDTAGRLQIDQAMMGELAQIKTTIQPQEVLLVVDAMTGQEAANLTRTFHEQIGITGAILTKLDGDARGGAALSVRQISGQPIKFIGTGEKVEALQPFYPERMASRILGMGDVLTLVEKAQETVDLADAERLQEKILRAQFDFSDFVQQLRLLKNMGSLGGFMKLIPGMNQIKPEQIQQAEKQLKRAEAMINSMTTRERQQPDILASHPSRRRRIAKGSGHTEAEVTKLVQDFQQMRTMMQRMSMGGLPGMGDAPNLAGMGSGRSARRKQQGKKRKGFGQL
ncbi:Signal recognition particle protein [Gloeomargarita lithophora Alchichica-D10]|uniref:Signal recognition particle protein n=1 Tax=Gloeomargarita lithophora Alchichica-D10 TaxID=1188229 RepID=A0A1J0AA15_9CYAN|nr:signal recognition particle protein [Gloeomargarita lithophora]APB32774.1 Signal recognition particle protein [Gloeomargarita lithophora Alchichica-D10]